MFFASSPPFSLLIRRVKRLGALPLRLTAQWGVGAIALAFFFFLFLPTTATAATSLVALCPTVEEDKVEKIAPGAPDVCKQLYLCEFSDGRFYDSLTCPTDEDTERYQRYNKGFCLLNSGKCDDGIIEAGITTQLQVLDQEISRKTAPPAQIDQAAALAEYLEAALGDLLQKDASELPPEIAGIVANAKQRHAFLKLLSSNSSLDPDALMREMQENAELVAAVLNAWMQALLASSEVFTDLNKEIARVAEALGSGRVVFACQTPDFKTKLLFDEASPQSEVHLSKQLTWEALETIADDPDGAGRGGLKGGAPEALNRMKSDIDTVFSLCKSLAEKGYSCDSSLLVQLNDKKQAIETELNAREVWGKAHPVAKVIKEATDEYPMRSRHHGVCVEFADGIRLAAGKMDEVRTKLPDLAKQISEKTSKHGGVFCPAEGLDLETVQQWEEAFARLKQLWQEAGDLLKRSCDASAGKDLVCSRTKVSLPTESFDTALAAKAELTQRLENSDTAKTLEELTETLSQLRADLEKKQNGSNTQCDVLAPLGDLFTRADKIAKALSGYDDFLASAYECQTDGSFRYSIAQLEAAQQNLENSIFPAFSALVKDREAAEGACQKLGKEVCDALTITLPDGKKMSATAALALLRDTTLPDLQKRLNQVKADLAEAIATRKEGKVKCEPEEPPGGGGGGSGYQPPSLTGLVQCFYGYDVCSYYQEYLTTGSFPPQCGLCELLQLAQRIINFMIYLAALAAAIAFVYAGILYVVSPANPGKIQEAHKIFWTVLWGLVITLAAWIIVNTVLVTLNGQNIADGTQILCAQPDPQKIVELCEKSVDWGEGGGTDEDGGGGGGGGTIGKFGEADKEVVAEFRQKGVEVTAGDAECQKPRKEITVDYCVHSSTKKFTCDEPGCTKLAGMQPTTKALLVEIAKACRANNDGKPCGIVITGGTEGKDHADGTYSHAKGYKFDVRDATAQRVGSALARLREEGLLVDAGNDTLKTTPKFKNLLGLKEEEDYCLVPRKETKHVDYAFRPC